jgi:hypothetical protein
MTASQKTGPKVWFVVPRGGGAAGRLAEGVSRSPINRATCSLISCIFSPGKTSTFIVMSHRGRNIMRITERFLPVNSAAHRLNVIAHTQKQQLEYPATQQNRFKTSSLKFSIPFLAALLVSPGCFAEEDDTDYHFRPFWVEPADRVELGSGHLVGGIDYEKRPEKGSRSRTTLPLEATLGLGYGFSTVLALDGGSHSVFDDNTTSNSASREMKLRYSFPEWNGMNFMVLTGVERPTGGGTSTYSNGFSFAIDTSLGTVGIGQVWDRKRPEDARGGEETAVNLFRTGLGSDQKWALGGEMRFARASDNQNYSRWLLGVGRVVGKGLMADFALGGTLEQHDSYRATAGLSWFF